MDCGACGRVCGVGAVRDSHGEPVQKVPRAQWAKPVVDTARCSACSMCVQICGKDALSISPPAFRGDIAVFARLTDENACVACGLCERICPLHAITMRKEAEA